MAFSDDITLNDGAADQTYSITSMIGGKSIRKDASQELSTPAVLSISHQVNGQGPSAIARRMVRLDRTLSSNEGEMATVSAHIVLTVPNSVITKADVSAEVAKLINFLQGAGNLDKLLNGEP